MCSKLFKKIVKLIFIVVSLLSGNNTLSTSLRDFHDKNFQQTRNPSLNSQNKNILSFPSFQDDKMDAYPNFQDYNPFRIFNTAPRPISLPLYNQWSIPDYSVPLSQYNSALSDYNQDAFNQYNQIPTQDYNQEMIAPFNMDLSQQNSMDLYGQYNPLLIQACIQNILRYLNQTPLRFYNQIPNYNQIQQYIPQYPEQFSLEEKNDRLYEVMPRYLQPNVPAEQERCIDYPLQKNIATNRRGSSMDKDLTKVPHVSPRRKNPKSSLQNQFGNPKVIKPLKNDGEDLLNQMVVDNEKSSRRGNFQNGKYGKHVVPTYKQQSRKYANPFKSTVIVAPGKENRNVIPDAKDDIIDDISQNNIVVQPSSIWNHFYPNIFGWFGRKRRDLSKHNFDIDRVAINKNNAGVDLLHSKRQENYENENMRIAREALRSLLRL